MIPTRFIIFVFLISYCFISVDLISQYPIILIISYDAFRFNYLSKGVNPVLSKLKDKGTHAEYMDNVFVTKTFPNHHSMATGVYPEFHGVLGNVVYDSLYKKALNYSYELWHYSDEILPIWIVNEKKGQGRHSGVMMWPGNEFEYNGTKPTYQHAWDFKVPWQKRVDGVVDWILNPEKPANLVLMYIEEPDYHSHSFGADSPQVIEELKLMDNITEYLVNKLEENNLTDHVNMFFLADHGSVSVTKKDVIDLREVVASDEYDFYEGSPVIHIYPKPGKATAVYGALKQAELNRSTFKVYKREDIPDEWHFKNNRRAPPILAVADPPHVFHDFYPYIEDIQKKWNFTANNDTTFGIHGYDNKFQLMKPYFVAVGPLIKEKFQVDPFKTVDLFSLWALMSGFPEYSGNTNGSLKIVSQILKEDPSPVASSNVTGIVVGCLVLVVAVSAFAWFCYKKRSSKGILNFEGLKGESPDSRQRLLDSDEDT